MQDFYPVCFIAISPGSFLESGFEIDRFVIIFYSVMICRLAFEAIITSPPGCFDYWRNSR